MKLWNRGLERSAGDPSGPLEVQPTVGRVGSRSDFLIRLSGDLKKSLGLGTRCIVADSRPGEVESKPRAVLAKIAIDDNLHPTQIRLDATLRAAM